MNLKSKVAVNYLAYTFAVRRRDRECFFEMGTSFAKLFTYALVHLNCPHPEKMHLNYIPPLHIIIWAPNIFFKLSKSIFKLYDLIIKGFSASSLRDLKIFFLI